MARYCALLISERRRSFFTCLHAGREPPIWGALAVSSDTGGAPTTGSREYSCSYIFQGERASTHQCMEGAAATLLPKCTARGGDTSKAPPTERAHSSHSASRTTKKTFLSDGMSTTEEVTNMTAESETTEQQTSVNETASTPVDVQRVTRVDYERDGERTLFLICAF